MQTPELFDLSGRTALVTGGGRGLGRAIAVGLAEAGADVIVVGRRAESLDETVAAIASTGRRANAIPGDLAQLDDVERIANEALALATPIDVLVNNAARNWVAPTFDYPMDGWDRVFDLNVRGLWALTMPLARSMRDHEGGSIVNITSVAATRAGPESDQPVIAYGASKGAIGALTLDLAIKWAPHRIRVNAISPGPFDTDMMNHIREDPALQAGHDAQVPLQRTGHADDIKGAVTFLASAASAYVTGHTLVVDGGISVQYPVRSP